MPVTFSSKHGAAQFFPILRIAGTNGVRAPVALTKAVCLIGRHRGVHLPLPSEQVSKIHALLVKQRDGVYLRDLASRNHVFVNGHPIRETDLATGDVIRVGPYTIQCASGFADPDADKPPGLRPAAAALESADMTSHLALEGHAVLVGSRDECDVVLSAGDVSPVHCVIFELDGRRHVRDLDSASGTFVNGQKIHQHELAPGDELRIGDTTLRYVEVQGEAQLPEDLGDDGGTGLSPGHEDLLELGTGLADVLGASADLHARDDATHHADDGADIAGTGLVEMTPPDEAESEPEPQAATEAEPEPEAESADHEEHEEHEDDLITLEVDPDHPEEGQALETAAPPEDEADTISLRDDAEPPAPIPVSSHQDDHADDHPELAHLGYEEEEEPDHPDALTPEMLEEREEEQAPPPTAIPKPIKARGLASQVPAPAPTPTEGLIPLIEGDRTVGVLDAAVQVAARHWNDPVITREAPDEFAHIPLVPIGGRDSAVGGLPLPPATAHQGYGELEEPIDREGEAPSDPSGTGYQPVIQIPSGQPAAPTEAPPPVAGPEAEHEPLSPDETITPASGDDDLRGEHDPAAPLGPASGAPTHPLFGLVQELQAAHADHKALDHPMAEGSDADLADLLKYDGAAAAPAPATPTAEHHESLRRTAVRKLDQIIHDLSDLVDELKSTWQQVKLGRHADHPVEPTDGAKENPRN